MTPSPRPCTHENFCIERTSSIALPHEFPSYTTCHCILHADLILVTTQRATCTRSTSPVFRVSVGPEGFRHVRCRVRIRSVERLIQREAFSKLCCPRSQRAPYFGAAYRTKVRWGQAAFLSLSSDPDTNKQCVGSCASDTSGQQTPGT